MKNIRIGMQTNSNWQTIGQCQAINEENCCDLFWSSIAQLLGTKPSDSSSSISGRSQPFLSLIPEMNCPRYLRFANEITNQLTAREIFGSQPSFVFALVASPSNSSTSVGR